jgi:hypothetical protein
MDHKEKPPVAMGQLRADEAGTGTTIVGGQPPGRGRSLPAGLPVGVEKVLYTAATDAAFREALLEDRAGAVRSKGLELRDTELSLLKTVPDAQLQAIIDGMDVSPENLERRGFLKTVAVATATVVAAESLAACGDDDDYPAPTGIQPDMPATRGIQPDMPSDARKDGGPGSDMGPAPTGIRPG